jgi:rhodanese-related sulfurtransferase
VDVMFGRGTFRTPARARWRASTKELPDPGARILTYCQFGRISTLAAATLRAMGYTRAVALDGGYDEWVKRGFPVEQ